MKCKINKVCLVMAIFLITIILTVWSVCDIFTKKEVFLDEVKLKEETTNNDLFAIKVEQSDGSYIDQYDIPLKENGYIFNAEKSGCMDADGQMLDGVLAYRNNMVKVDVRGTTYCYLYFDLISDGDFCIEQGITNLRDCLLVMEDYSYDTEEAIDYITNKGSATTNAIAPTVVYEQKSSNQTNSNGVISTIANFSLSTSYTFDNSTGQYTLQDFVTTTMSDDYIGYYTCGDTTFGFVSCSTMYKINAYKVVDYGTVKQYVVTDADVYTFNAVDSFDSEVGLYTAEDSDGTTYFYRGAVKNNYVSFGGFIWRVVRINGNGTIRMIYAGTSATEIGTDDQIGTAQYNSKYWDPTYVGYTYDDASFVYRENTTLTTYSNMTSTAKYYYGTEISCDASTRKCTLAGEKMSGVWSEVYSTVLNGGYKYTCFSTSADGNCDFAFKLDSYVNQNSANGYYISYNSPDYATTLKDTTDSNIKTVIDKWYENNLLNETDSNGIKYSDYIDINGKFCNDRQFYAGNGYSMAPLTWYNSYNRIVHQKKPSLYCGQESDIFSVSKGNLDYPIALLTVDEVSLAGGGHGYVNNQYYLYTGEYYWTMSPTYFYEPLAMAIVWNVELTGSLTPWPLVSGASGVRPVINLKSNVSITKGTGTAENPYELTIN